MRKFVLTLSILLAACAFTFAGNGPKEQVMEMPRCAQFGGWDVGLNLGGAMLDSTWNDNDDWIDNFNDDFNTSNPSKDRWGVSVGGTAGYTWQKGCAIFGLIADGAWTSIDGSNTHTPSSDTDSTPTFLRIHDSVDFWATARARSGVVVDNLLLYVTGGFVFADIDHHWSVESVETLDGAARRTDAPNGDGTNVQESFSTDSFRWGGVAGVGAEWALNDRWSVRSEFLYAIFAEEHTSGFSQAANQDVHFDTQDKMGVGQISVVYRFGGR